MTVIDELKQKAQNPVALFLNGIGDHFITLPALRSLATILDGRLSLICHSNANSTFFSDLSLRSVHEIDCITRQDGHIAYDLAEVTRTISKCDWFFCFNRSFSPTTARLMEFFSPHHSAGFFDAFDIRFPLKHDSHAADIAFQIPNLLAPWHHIEDFAAPPPLANYGKRIASSIWRKLPQFLKVIVVHAETSPEKMWPLDRLTEALDIFLSTHKDFFAFVVSNADLHLNRGRCGNRVVSCHGLPLVASFGLVKRADLFLGVDSCMLHAADLFRVPGVGLFAPTDCREFGFRFTRHRHVSGKEDMRTIKVDEVVNALDNLLLDLETSES